MNVIIGTLYAKSTQVQPTVIERWAEGVKCNVCDVNPSVLFVLSPPCDTPLVTVNDLHYYFLDICHECYLKYALPPVPACAHEPAHKPTGRAFSIGNDETAIYSAITAVIMAAGDVVDALGKEQADELVKAQFERAHHQGKARDCVIKAIKALRTAQEAHIDGRMVGNTMTMECGEEC